MSFRGEFDLEAPRSAIVGETFKAKLTATNETGAPTKVPHANVTVSVVPSQGTPTAAPSGDALDITYKPTQTGQFTLIIKAFGKEVFEWKVDVTGHVDAARSYAELSEPYRCNQRGKIVVVPCDSRGNQIKAVSPDVDINYEGPGALEEMALEELSDDTLALVFVPTKSGNYEVLLKIGGVHLQNSPLKFVVN